MRILLFVSLAAVASLHSAFAQTGAVTPPAPQYRISVRNGIITLTDVKTGELLARTTFEKWGISSPTRDKLRHVALDVTAAVIAGHGAREHTVDPKTPVYTSAEKEKAPYVTATLEHGVPFVLVSDKQTENSYEALILGAINSGGH